MIEFWVWFVIIIVVAIGTTLYYVLRQGIGFSRVSAQQPPWHRVKCDNCDGMGVLWLYEGKLMIIPEHRRATQQNGWNPDLANAVTCDTTYRRPGATMICHGFGFIRVRDDKPVPRGQR
jgi:hypothetical protein